MILIDADNFRRYVHEQLEGNKTYTIDEILEMIDEQPTAFDIEKVIAELEKKSHREESREFDRFYNRYLTFETDKVVYLDEAKEIIEAGGVE